MASFMEQKDLELDGEKYLLSVFTATVGLNFQYRLGQEGLSPDLVKDLVMKGCTKGSVQIDAKLFDRHFAGKYGHLFRLAEEIIKYNFDDIAPNVESDSEEA